MSFCSLDIPLQEFWDSLPDNSKVLFSGLIGVLIGGLLNYRLARYRQWLEAKTKLGHLLITICDEFERGIESSIDPYVVLNKHYPNIWVYGRDVANLVTLARLDKRRKILALTKRLEGKQEGGRLAERSFLKSEEAYSCAKEFLKLLGYE